MKKILVCALSLLMFTSCYEDYVKDYDTTTVYFAMQYNTRTVIVGERNTISVGACLAGPLYNKLDRNVKYQINSSLIDDTTLATMQGSSYLHVKNSMADVEAVELMPADYVSYSDESTMVIPKNDHLGMIEVEVDMDKFLSEPEKTINPAYVIPFEMTSCADDVDVLLEGKTTSLIGIQYESLLYGVYWHGGQTVVKDAAGNVVDTKTYPLSVPQDDALVWTLSTTDPYTVVTDQIGDGMTQGAMKLEVDIDSGAITVSGADGSAVVAQNDGECYFNKSKLLQDRQICLKYKFDNGDGTTSHVTDTLLFRNRVRDGVTEWQDENPENYK